MTRKFPQQISTVPLRLFFGISLLLNCSTLVAQESGKELARLVSSSADITVTRPKPAKLAGTLSPKSLPSIDEATWIERRAFDLTNDVRQRNGLSPLNWDPVLCQMARVHSEKMARENFFSHQSPDGQRLRDRARSNGIGRFKVLAENIAYNQGFEDPGAFAVERWMISSKHRANILQQEFQGGAVGVFVSNDGSVYLTQAFIAR